MIKCIEKIIPPALEARLLGGFVGMVCNPAGHLFQSRKLALCATSSESSSCVGNHGADFLPGIVDELTMAAVLYLRRVRVGMKDLHRLGVDFGITIESFGN